MILMFEISADVALELPVPKWRRDERFPIGHVMRLSRVAAPPSRAGTKIANLYAVKYDD